jgi:predicted ester cyclase
MSAENKSVIRRWIEAINRGDLEAGAQLLDSNYVRHLPGLESRGPEGFKQVAAMFLSGFPDLKLTIEDLIAEGDRVVVRFTARGTQFGDFAGGLALSDSLGFSVLQPVIGRDLNGFPFFVGAWVPGEHERSHRVELRDRLRRHQSRASQQAEVFF